RVDLPHRAMRLGDPGARHERGHREAAQRDDQGRIEDLQLSLQEWPAGSDLVRQRIAIVRRPALHDVGDEDLVTRPLDRREQLDELVAGPSHERPPQAVFVEPRSLADEHDLGGGVALAGNRVGSGFVQPTSLADADLPGDDLERRLALGVRHAPPAGAPARRDAARTWSRLASSSASSTVFVAAGFRRLSLTTQNAIPRPSGMDGSVRTRPTNTSSRPGASVASG